jgi:hypothetical protein
LSWLTKQKSQNPWDYCGKVIESRAVIVRGIVMVKPFTHEPDEEVSIHSLVMMERNETKIVQSENCSHSHDEEAGNEPAPI